MASSYLFRIDTVKPKRERKDIDIILDAMKHNKRTIEKESGNIDRTKSHLNYALHGVDTPENIATHANVLIAKAGITKLRKNAVKGVEIIFSLPIDRHQHDTKPFFKDCYEWVKGTFAGELLSFDVHLDEAAPHAHAIILPLVNGKMKGSAMVGGIDNLNRLINLFHSDVAKHHGLSRSDRKRLGNSDREALECEVLKRLRGDSVMSSVIWPLVRDGIKQNPTPYAQLLAINPPAKAQKIIPPKSFLIINERPTYMSNPI